MIKLEGGKKCAKLDFPNVSYCKWNIITTNNIIVLCNVTSRNLVRKYHISVERYCQHVDGMILTLKKLKVHFSESLVPIYVITPRHIIADSNLTIGRPLENLNYRNLH
jgi:hypothetical protein